MFALRVKGQSMIEDGILDGDIVIIRRQGKLFQRRNCGGSSAKTALLHSNAVTVNGTASVCSPPIPNSNRFMLAACISRDW